MLEPIGRIENIEDENLEPFEVPIIGYLPDKTEVETIIRFNAMAPLGFERDMLNSVGLDNKIQYVPALQYVTGCVYADDKEKWDELLHSPKIIIFQQTILALYTAIGEVYTGRPFSKRLGSKGGPSPTKRTSQAAVSEKAPTKKGSR